MAAPMFSKECVVNARTSIAGQARAGDTIQGYRHPCPVNAKTAGGGNQTHTICILRPAPMPAPGGSTCGAPAKGGLDAAAGHLQSTD